MRHSATFTRKSGLRLAAPARRVSGVIREVQDKHGRGIGALGEWADVAVGVSRRSGRSLREGAWIPVSAHENDAGGASMTKAARGMVGDRGLGGMGGCRGGGLAS